MEGFANIFAEATEYYGGIVARDNEVAGRRFLASTFEGIEKAITRKDNIHGGLALELSDKEARLYAYSLRLVCSNGLISTFPEEKEEFTWFRETEFEEAIYRKYAELETTASQVAGYFREAQQQPADEKLWQYVLNSLNQLQFNRDWMNSMIRALSEERRRSASTGLMRSTNNFNRFEVVNALTAIARDTNEPGLRWQLEKLGGELLVATSNESVAPVKKHHLEAV